MHQNVDGAKRFDNDLISQNNTYENMGHEKIYTGECLLSGTLNFPTPNKHYNYNGFWSWKVSWKIIWPYNKRSPVCIWN